MRTLLGIVAFAVACEAQPPGPTDTRLLEHPTLEACSGEKPADPLVLASWNMSAARRASLSEVEAAIAELDADVVLLQENDVGVNRTGNVHQPAVLAEALGYEYAFAEALEWDGGVFGLSVLSRLRFHRVERRSLFASVGYEPRIALDVELCHGPDALRFVNVHADFEAPANAENLTDLAEQLGQPTDFTVVAGDFNAEPDAASIQAFATDTALVDTFASRDPSPTHRNKRVDYAFVPPDVDAQILTAENLPSPTSDHDRLRVTVDAG